MPRSSISERTPSPFAQFTPTSIDQLINSVVDSHTHDDLADRRDVDSFLRRNR